MDNGNEKKLIVKLICVLMAFGLWLYVTNVENPTRKSDIRDVAVELINTDTLATSNLTLAPNQKFTVDIKVEGPANEIYSLNKDEFKLTADISAYALKKGENTIPVQVVNYPQGIYIKNNGVLAVKVKIDDLIKKEMKVESKVKVTYKQGFSQKSASINPDVIKLMGPATEIGKVAKVALVGELDNIDKDVEEKFSIKAFDAEDNEVKGIELSETEGILAIKVGKGKEVAIKPTYTGTLQDGLSIDNIELSRNKINISGDIDKIDIIEYLELEPINLSNVNGSREFNLKIKLQDGIAILGGDEYVTVKLKVKSAEAITKVFDNIKIEYIGTFNNEIYNYEKPTVASLTLSGTEIDLATISENNIRLEAIIGELKEGDNTIELTAMLINTDRKVSVKSNSGPIVVKVTKK